MRPYSDGYIRKNSVVLQFADTWKLNLIDFLFGIVKPDVLSNLALAGRMWEPGATAPLLLKTFQYLQVLIVVNASTAQRPYIILECDKSHICFIVCEDLFPVFPFLREHEAEASHLFCAFAKKQNGRPGAGAKTTNRCARRIWREVKRRFLYQLKSSRDRLNLF